MGRTSDARERLLKSAAELVHERGYAAVGINDICSSAGVNKGSFYHFFPSKQDLVLAVIDEFWHGTRAFLDESLTGDGPPLERLARHFEALYESHRGTCSIRGRQLGCPLANLGLEMSTQDLRLRDRLAQAFEAQLGYYERLLREARRLGDIPDAVDPRGAAESILSLIEGKILLSKLRDDPETMKGLGPIAMRLIAGTS